MSAERIEQATRSGHQLAPMGATPGKVYHCQTAMGFGGCGNPERLAGWACCGRAMCLLCANAHANHNHGHVPTARR